MEAAVGLHQVEQCSVVLGELPHPVCECRELGDLGRVGVLGHPAGRLGFDQEAELVEIAKERLGLALAAHRLLDDGAEDVPLLGRAHLGALAVLDVHHPEHGERLHGLPGNRATDAVAVHDLLRGGERFTDADAPGHDLRREKGGQLAAQALGLLQPLATELSAVSRHAHQPLGDPQVREVPFEQAAATPRRTSLQAPAGRRARARRAGRGRAWRRCCSGRSNAASRRRAPAESRETARRPGSSRPARLPRRPRTRRSTRSPPGMMPAAPLRTQSRR